MKQDNAPTNEKRDKDKIQTKSHQGKDNVRKKKSIKQCETR